jgi:hypothetical protein
MTKYIGTDDIKTQLRNQRKYPLFGSVNPVRKSVCRQAGLWLSNGEKG